MIYGAAFFRIGLIDGTHVSSTYKRTDNVPNIYTVPLSLRYRNYTLSVSSERYGTDAERTFYSLTCNFYVFVFNRFHAVNAEG